MPAHHQPHRSSGEDAAVSSRRPCRKASLILQPVRYVDLDQAHEEAAVAALADLIVPYLEPEEDAA